MLLSIDEYQRLTGPAASIVDMLAMKPDDSIDFEAVPLTVALRPVDFG